PVQITRGASLTVLARSSPGTARIVLDGCRDGVKMPYAARRGLASRKAVDELLVSSGKERSVFLAIGNLPFPPFERPFLGSDGPLELPVRGFFPELAHFCQSH